MASRRPGVFSRTPPVKNSVCANGVKVNRNREQNCRKWASLPARESSIDSFPSVTDAPERSLSIVGRVEVNLAKVYMGEEILCDTLDRCRAVSLFLLERAPIWLEDET